MQSNRMAMIHLHFGTAVAVAASYRCALRLDCYFHFSFAENSSIPDLLLYICGWMRVCVSCVCVCRYIAKCACIKIVMLQLNAETLWGFVMYCHCGRLLCVCMCNGYGMLCDLLRIAIYCKPSTVDLRREHYPPPGPSSWVIRTMIMR